jgi:hypothetical protein
MIPTDPTINNQISDDEIAAAQHRYRSDPEISRIIECLIVTRQELWAAENELKNIRRR